MAPEVMFLGGFLILIFIVLAIDLNLGKKGNGEVSVKQAGVMTLAVVLLSMSFYVFLINFGHLLHGITDMPSLQKEIASYGHPSSIAGNNYIEGLKQYDHSLGLEFLSGYIVEYALSVDNIFVILLIFSSFKVPARSYHKVLFWGILGALIMRFGFIFLGAALISRFEWIMYVFGVFLVITGLKMFVNKEEEDTIDVNTHPVVRFANKYFKVHNRFVGQQFWVTVDGVRKMTPLFLVLLIVETTDVIFAVDSIPAIFSITKDPYIVFFSNIFAVIGLRSMFFILAGIVDKFHFLKTGLAVLLTFIGIKMIFPAQLEQYGFSNLHSLLLIIGILAGSILASLLFPKKV